MNYDAINAKVSAMRASLLKPHDYAALASGRAASPPVMPEDRLFPLISDMRLRRLLTEKNYLHIWQGIKSLPDQQNRRAIRLIKGTEVDLLNIMWIYRLKVFLAGQPGQIYPYLIPIQFRLGRGILKVLTDCPGRAELLAELQYTYYAHVFGSFGHMEKSYAQEMRRTYSIASKRYPRSVARLMGYLFDKEIETQNCHAIAEGIRYQLSPEEIFASLRL